MPSLSGEANEGTLRGLFPGSRFEGTQRSGRSSYDVEVELQDVDLDNSFLCGYLKISGLTEEYPVLTTYFEAEIVGRHHNFVTEKWDADEHTDWEHWSKFSSFAKYQDDMRLTKHKIEPLTADNVYMRWKEHFLVPDHQIVSIAGASFAGFYYIRYERSTAAILGFYYHQSSEMFQSLRLHHVPQKSFPSFEFR
mmetsp:Transcript_18034/g.41736  ORF Transcript_18034/g.41736 Transcript_18034/m.41736 type:complete len:194 (-) Transcript_18034:469-1050(-)